MLLTIVAILLLLQDAGQTHTSMPTGLEWMAIASIVVPAILLIVLIYLGSENTVRR